MPRQFLLLVAAMTKFAQKAPDPTPAAPPVLPGKGLVQHDFFYAGEQWSTALDPSTAPVQALEITPDKPLVWALRSWTDPLNLGPSTTVPLLDEKSVFGDIR